MNAQTSGFAALGLFIENYFQICLLEFILILQPKESGTSWKHKTSFFLKVL